MYICVVTCMVYACGMFMDHVMWYVLYVYSACMCAVYDG